MGAVDILWIRNNQEEGPPVVFLNTQGGPLVVTLTNQTFYVNCPACFQAKRLAVAIC